MTKATSFRLPDSTNSQIEELATLLDTDKTAIVVMAIRDMYREEMRTMNWNQATAILADRNSTQEQRHEAAQRIQVDLDRQGDDGLWDWILEGDWTGDETPESVKAELAEIEEA